MSTPSDPIDAVSVSQPFRPSQELDELEANGFPAADLRAKEEAAHGTAMAQPVAHMAAVVKVTRVDTVTAWAKRKKIPAWLLKAAAVGARWQIGEEFDPLILDEATFDAAISFAENPHAHLNPPAKV